MIRGVGDNLNKRAITFNNDFSDKYDYFSDEVNVERYAQRNTDVISYDVEDGVDNTNDDDDSDNNDDDIDDNGENDNVNAGMKGSDNDFDTDEENTD